MSVGQRALLVFIDWSFMPPPPQKQQLKFPKQEAMTKKDPELPCPLGCGMTCQGYTGTQYGNDRDQHTHIHNTCCRKDFYHISEINIRTSADLLSSFRFRGPGEMAYDAEVEGTPMLMTTISPDQLKLLLTLRRVDSSVKTKVLSVITSHPHMMFRFERVSGANCYSEATSLSFSVVEGGQPAVADTVKSLVALVFRKEQDKQDLGELINTYSELCNDLPTEEECCKELAANGRYARKFKSTYFHPDNTQVDYDEDEPDNEVSFTSQCIQNSVVRRKNLKASLLGKFLAPLGEDMIFGRSETAVHARKILKLLTVFLDGECEHSRLTTVEKYGWARYANQMGSSEVESVFIRHCNKSDKSETCWRIDIEKQSHGDEHFGLDHKEYAEAQWEWEEPQGGDGGLQDWT